MPDSSLSDHWPHMHTHVRALVRGYAAFLFLISFHRGHSSSPHGFPIALVLLTHPPGSVLINYQQDLKYPLARCSLASLARSTRFA